MTVDVTLESLNQTFNSSPASDWEMTLCDGPNYGPSYRDQFELIVAPNTSHKNLVHRSHRYVASYKRDISITIAWGLADGDKYGEENRRPTIEHLKQPQSLWRYLDFFYNGALVQRRMYFDMSDKRLFIPATKEDATGTQFVTDSHYSMIGRLNEIMGFSGYKDYMKREGKIIVEDDFFD